MKAVLCLLASACALISYANTYYISSSEGNDGNNGRSTATAWKTLAKAGAQTYGPGDSILLKRGDTWTEKLIIANSNGSSDAPIVLAAYGSGNKPIIQRSSNNGICLLLTDPSWWHFSNISFGPACQGIMLKLTKAGNTNILVDSCFFNQLQGLSWPGGTNDGEWFVQSSGVGVKGTFTGSPLIENITVKRCLADRCYALENVNVDDNSWPGYLVKNLIIEDCKTTNGVHGIWVHSVDGGYADRCTVLSSGSTYFHAGVTGIGIERTRNFDIRNSLVDSVKFQGTDGCAFDFEGACSNVKVLNSVFKNSEGVGFMSYNKKGWANQNCLIEGTTFINCNATRHFANEVNEVLAGTGIMRNCIIRLQNDAQAYQSGGYVTTTTNSRTWTFESNNVVYGPDETPPSAPSGLAATVDERRVDLSWQKAEDLQSGIRAYRIFRDGRLIGESAAAAYADSCCLETTTYSYRVAAVNGSGLEGPASPAVQATTQADATPPSVTRVTAQDPTLVIVVFNEPVDPLSASDASHYALSGGATVSGTALASGGLTVILTTSALTDGTEYTLTVNGVQDASAAGNELVGGAKSFTYFSATPLPAGYLKTLLLLENAQASAYLPAASEAALTTAAQARPSWSSGDNVSADGAAYTWTRRTDVDGLWLDAGQDNFVGFAAITIVSSSARTLLFKYRHDDDFYVWVNGTPVISAGGWDNGAEQTSAPFTLPAGRANVLVRLKELQGGNLFALRFTNDAGNDLTDLGYLLLGGQTGPANRPSLSSLAARPASLVVKGAAGARVLTICGRGPLTASVLTTSGRLLGAATGHDHLVVDMAGKARGEGVVVVRIEQGSARTVRTVVMR